MRLSTWLLLLTWPIWSAVVVAGVEVQAAAQHRAQIGLRAGVRSRLRQRQRNPLLDTYRSWAIAYEKDAAEAEAAAEKYAAMTQAVVAGGSAGGASTAVRQEMSKLHAKDLANKIWDFEAKLRDPRPAEAARAAAEAEKPYKEDWKAYVAARNSYMAAAIQHAQRVKANSELVKQLQAYSQQSRLEGNMFKASQYARQAASLMKQVSSEAGLTKDYQDMVRKLSGVIPSLWDMSYTAANLAAYNANPMGSLPASQLMPTTVAPPPMDLVMQAYATQAAEAAKASMATPR